MIKLVNKIKYILFKLQTKSFKYEFLIIPVLICCVVCVPCKMKSVPCKMIPWERSNIEEVKKVKRGYWKMTSWDHILVGEQFKRK